MTAKIPHLVCGLCGKDYGPNYAGHEARRHGWRKPGEQVLGDVPQRIPALRGNHSHRPAPPSGEVTP